MEPVTAAIGMIKVINALAELARKHGETSYTVDGVEYDLDSLSTQSPTEKLDDRGVTNKDIEDAENQKPIDE